MPMLIGYMRPFPGDVTCEEQTKKLMDYQCQIFVKEKHISPKNRVELRHMIDNLQQGDKVIVYKLFAIADSSRQLVDVLSQIEDKNAYFQSIEEGINTEKIDGKPFKAIIQSIVDFQTDIASVQTKRGLSEAKQKGSHIGRPRLADESVRQAVAMYQSKQFSLAQIKEKTGISKSTLYRYLEK